MLGLATVVKLGYLAEYAGLPFLDGPLGDSVVYLHQARSIADGDLADASLLAMSPLYGAFLALLGAPSQTTLTIAVQLVLGLVNLWLVYDIARSRFDARSGLAAALLYLGYGLFLFYETKLLSETLGLTLALLTTRAYLSGRFRDGGIAVAAAGGALLGLAVLARASLFLALPFFVLFALAPWSPVRTPLGVRIRRAAGLAGGAAAVLGARGLLALATAGVFVPVVYTSPDASITGRAASTEWRGRLGDVAHDPTAPLAGPWDVVHAVERDLARRDRGGPRPGLLRTLGSIDVLGLLRTAPPKLARTFTDIETSFQYGYYGERTTSRMLGALPVTFHVLLLLAFAGGAFLVRREGVRALVPYLPLVFGCILIALLFHPSSRYRLPMALPLVLLGGHGAVEIVRTLRQRAMAIAGALVAVACLGSSVRTLRYELSDPARWELTQAESWAIGGGEPMEVLTHIERAQELSGHDPDVERRIAYILALAGIERRTVPQPGP